MTKEDFNQLITNGDMENFCVRLISEIKKMIEGGNDENEFYSIKEYSNRTGIKYSTVAYRCKTGRLKARQDYPGCAWSIHKSELEKFIQNRNNFLN